MRRSIATPCPVATSQTKIIDETYTEDTTSKLEYTTAFHASFRNVRPKRRQVVRGSTANFAIHEDVAVIDQSDVGRPQDISHRLSHPARRAAAQRRSQDARLTTQNATLDAQHRVPVHSSEVRRPPVAAKRPPTTVVDPEHALRAEEKESYKETSSRVERPARRKTLYIPSDDTTQPTMWMGIFSPIKNEIEQNRGNYGQEPMELTGIAAQMAEKRRSRTSNIQPKAKRVPLQHNSSIQAQASDTLDRPGAPTGKENFPPGHLPSSKESQGATLGRSREKMQIDRETQRKRFLAQARSERISNSRHQPGSTSPEICTMYEIGIPDIVADVEKSRRIAWNAGPRATARTAKTAKEEQKAEQIRSDQSRESQSLPTAVPTRFVPPSLHNVPKVAPYIPIVEHIECPEMYEDDWLGQQEIVMTQLLNSLLSQEGPTGGQASSLDEIRSKLLSRYNSQDIYLIYNRVQAASMYGSLSLTHEAIFQLQNLVHDIGRRKAFLKFWIDNYDSDLLSVALEVVSGRQVPVSTVRRSSSTNSSEGSRRQNIASFIESYILRHEDAQFKAAGSGSVSDLGSKTIVKSVMLLKALDLLKEENAAIVPKCLFRKSAPIKSSITALQTMMQMLNPTVGDTVRALRQLGYAVTHQQKSLDELTCEVENIAVDLRDGICLTRLAEVLLYRSKSREVNEVINQEDTIAMSNGQTILVSNHESYPLSKHLKIPSVSRATKMWNVQIALGALQNVNNIKELIHDVYADDIVDGYREKTIKLLWMIVGRCGLASFIDRDDLKQEIRRLSRPRTTGDRSDGGDGTASSNECETLVKEWVEAVARSRGLQVLNFTTSFSDGRIFEAILDEYQPYLVKDHKMETALLHERLLRLGCSKQFSDLFSGGKGQVHIFGKDFVLAALAFLCSRVVGPSRTCRSAIWIQRCWRQYWHRVQQERQAAKRDVAEACAASARQRLGHVAGDTNLTNIDLSSMSNATSDERAKTEIEEDIWLSL